MTTSTAGLTPIRELLLDHLDLSEPMTLQERASLLRGVIDITADLNAVRSELEASLAADMETDQVPTPFGTLVRSQGGRRTAWDGETVVSRIVHRFKDGWDPVTGEALDQASLAARVAEDLASCGGLTRPSHGWRAGELKSRGIRVSDVCEYVEGETKVRFA